MKKHLLFLFAALLPLVASAHDFEVKGIYYSITSSAELTVAVTFKGDSYDSYSDEYSGAVTIPSTVTYNNKTYSVTSIGYQAFRDCNELTTITIPESVTSIGNHAFYGCYLLTSITIPEGVTSIRSYAFYGCGRLADITIPENVTSIGSYAFYGCGIKTITIPEGVTSIGDYVFSDCKRLTSITLPEGVTSIGKEAFSWCESLTTITIPESVTHIGEWAFYRCWCLTSITIPEGVTSIRPYAFYGCSKLTSITLPEGVTSIGKEAFCYCESLTTITIPENVTSIGEEAFCYCNSLKSIICEAVTPPTLGDYVFFYGTNANLTIYVPETSIEKYRSASGWSNQTLQPIPGALSTSKYYRIKNVSTGLYLQVEGNNTNMKLQNKAKGVAMTQVFQLGDADGSKYYIKAADADNRYYAHATGWNFNATNYADDKTPFTIAPVTDELGVYTLYQSVAKYQGMAGTDASVAGSPVYCNKDAAKNGKWTFEALTAEEQVAYAATLTAIAIGELSNTALCAVLQPNHSKGATSWAVQEDGQALKSNHDLGLSVDGEDARQQFAFVSNDGGTTHYLYHAAEAKFVTKDGSLVDKPVDAIQFMVGAYDNTFVAYFDDSHYINVGGSRQMLINSWSTADGGNSCVIVPVGEFDPTEALKAFESDDTGIDHSEFSNQKTEIIYDLTGRRVTDTKGLKGIYIVNGKKVVIK